MSTLSADSTSSVDGADRAASTEDPSIRDVTAVVLNHDGLETLPATLDSLLTCGFAFAAFVLADDGSRDGSREWFRSRHPGARLVGPETNSRNPNQVRNLGLRATGTRYAFLIDDDIVVQPGCVEELLAALERHRDAVCATPRILDREAPDRVYADGGAVHFLAVSRRRVAPGAACPPPGEPFPSCGSGIMLIDLQRAARIGLFDERYAFGWGDDGELHLRSQLLGATALHVPRACCLHRAKSHGTHRAYAQLRNRWRMMLTYWSARTLCLTLPSVLAFELALAASAARRGFGPQWRAAARDTWRARREIAARRRELQAARSRRDSELLECGGFDLPGAVSPARSAAVALRVAQAAFDLNWRLVRRFV